MRGSERDWIAPEEILLKIAAHLKGADEGFGHPYSGKSRAHVERAQDVLEEMLGALPRSRSPSMKKPLDHLEEANALAKEHLGTGGTELDLAEALAEAVRQARREF